tara:strand:+ start:739 stop:957 length:219 start_codon:yes stop_codon:yes gene_type:complete
MCLAGAPDPPKMPEIPLPPPMPSPMYKEPDLPELALEPEAREKTPKESMKKRRKGFSQFRVRNPGLVIKNKR